VVFLHIMLATWGLHMSFYVKKLSSPQNYFEITEEDFREIPKLKEIFVDLQKLAPGEERSYELDFSTGNKISEYLTEKQAEVGECGYTYCFKYGDAYYGAHMGTP
jgi:hypothetical protein